MPDLFADVKVGDEICAIVVGYAGITTYKVAKVARVTPNHFIAGGYTYRKSDGRSIGEGYGFNARPLDDEARSRIEEYNNTRRAQLLSDNLGGEIRRLHYAEDLPLLERIKALLDEHAKEVNDG